MAGMFLTLIITIFIVWVVVRILRELFGGYARRLRHTVRVRQPPLVSRGTRRTSPPGQQGHQAASPPAPQRR